MLNHLKKDKIIAIVRGISEEQADATADALFEGGIRFIEVTMNTPGATEMIRGWRQRYDGKMFIGAGTVLTTDEAKQAIDAGAQYIITPNIDEDVIRYAVEAGIDIYPGGMTPTEIATAWKLGARAVKVFPASLLGPSYIKELQGPLSHIPLIATGGVNLDNMVDYVRAGACGFGIGSNIINKSLINAGEFEKLKALAASYVKAVEQLPS